MFLKLTIEISSNRLLHNFWIIPSMEWKKMECFQVFEHCISRFLYYASELMRENMDPLIRRIVEEHFSADLNNKFVNKFV